MERGLKVPQEDEQTAARRIFDAFGNREPLQLLEKKREIEEQLELLQLRLEEGLEAEEMDKVLEDMEQLREDLKENRLVFAKLVTELNRELRQSGDVDPEGAAGWGKDNILPYDRHRANRQ